MLVSTSPLSSIVSQPFNSTALNTQYATRNTKFVARIAYCVTDTLAILKLRLALLQEGLKALFHILTVDKRAPHPNLDL